MSSFDENTVDLLDVEQIEMLFETGGDEGSQLMDELLELYSSECMVKFNEIGVALANATTDTKVTARHAHAVAGSSANIGAKRMWFLAKKLEASLETGDSKLASELYPTLLETFKETLVSLRTACQ